MKQYIENEMDPKESLIEYEYHIDDITLVGFKILSLPLKRMEWPNWFSNFNDRVDVSLKYLKYSKEYIYISDIANDYKRENTMYNHLSVGDYIIYDSRFDKVYATNYDGMLNLFNTITGYTYELLLDAAFESDKMPVDKDKMFIANGAHNTINPSTGGVNYSKDDKFTYHEPFEETSKRYQEIRTLAKMFSDVVDNLVPKSREASLAQTKIEEAVMWANAGIARNIKKEE